MSTLDLSVFEEVVTKAEEFNSEWVDFAEELRNDLPDVVAGELDNLNAALDQAKRDLIKSLKNPVLSLATTGTTSSGKSSIINMLCGVELLPVSQQEKSSGTVTIRYNTVPRLVIEKTPDAVWECGDWQDIDADKIRSQLNETMENYLAAKYAGQQLAPPEALVEYPIWIQSYFRDLGLPESVELEILDLPGLRTEKDTVNAKVIRQRCRKALCLMAYNSLEHNDDTVDKALRVVVDQIKLLGGSPKRMLFILNRIDEFRSDIHEWPASEHKFEKRITEKIKTVLNDRLKEYSHEIDNIQVTKLSSWAALLSKLMKNGQDPEGVFAARLLGKHFEVLFDDELLDDLPRNPEKWETHEFNKIAEYAWDASYGNVFFEHLLDHIRHNFPQLVIPQIIEEYRENGCNLVTEWAIQSINAIINSSDEAYARESRNIEAKREKLKECLEENVKVLHEPFFMLKKNLHDLMESASVSDDQVAVLTDLENSIKELGRELPYTKDNQYILTPLFEWRQEVGAAIQQIIEPVAKSLLEGQVQFVGTPIMHADTEHRKALEQVCNDLIALDYTGWRADEGWLVEAKYDKQKSKLKSLNNALNRLAESMRDVMQSAVAYRTRLELLRVFDTVEKLFKLQCEHIVSEGRKVAPEIGLNLPLSQLEKIDRDFHFDISLEAGFPVEKATWYEEVRVQREKPGWGRRLFGKVFPRLLTKKVQQQRSSDNAEIPSVHDVVSGWYEQITSIYPEIMNQFLDWLVSQINGLKNDVNKFQDDLLDRYKAKLDEIHNALKAEYDAEASFWEVRKQKAHALRDFSETITLDKMGEMVDS